MDLFFKFISYMWLVGLAGSVLVVIFVLYQMAVAIAVPGPLEETEEEPSTRVAKGKKKEPGDPLHTH